MKELVTTLIGKWCNLVFDTMDKIKEKTGVDVEKKIIRSVEKDEQLREEHPARWALKKIGKGAFWGIFGAGVHNSLSD